MRGPERSGEMVEKRNREDNGQHNAKEAFTDTLPFSQQAFLPVAGMDDIDAHKRRRNKNCTG